MSKHSTNYYTTFIEIAEDSRAIAGVIPPLRGNKKTVARLQFERLIDHPYEFTSDEVLFDAHAEHKAYETTEMDEQRMAYFSKGQPCFRASPLTKRYGWGIHSNETGQIAIFSVDSPDYQQFLVDDSIKKVKAMRSKRK